MQFKRLEIQNFGCILHLETDLDEQGLVFVEGIDKDQESDPAFTSNACGKSWATSDSIYWCLFGKLIRDERPTSVVRNRSKDGTFVRLQLTIRDKELDLIRYREHPEHGNNLKILVNGEDLSGSTMRLSEDVLRKLLAPMDEHLFRYTVMFGQGMPDRFSRLTDAGRKELIERIVGMDLYERARTTARKRHDILMFEVSRLHGKHEARQETLKERNKNHTQMMDRLHELRQKLEKTIADEHVRATMLEQRIERHKGMVSSLMAEISELSVQADQKTVLSNKLHERVKHIGHEIDKVSNKLAWVTSEDTCPTCGQKWHTTDEDRQRHLKLKTKHRRLKSQLALLEPEAESQEARLQVMIDRKRELRQMVNAAASDVDRNESELATLKQSHSQGSLDAAEDALSESQQDILSVRGALEALEKKLNTAKQDAKVLKTLQQGFGNMRIGVMSSVIDYLNDKIGLYLGPLTNEAIGAKLMLDASGRVQLDVTMEGGTFGSGSGGEKDRVDIAVAFALNKLAFAMSGMRSNLLVIDEPGTYLDSAGTSRMVRLLQKMAEETGTILLMSHRREARALVATRWSIVKKNRSSTLVK